MSGPRIFVAGHRGPVGSAIVRRLQAAGQETLTVTREQLHLRDQAAVNDWFQANRPEVVYLAAGTVGGIMPNSSRPVEFIYDNRLIHATVVHAARQYGWRHRVSLKEGIRSTYQWYVGHPSHHRRGGGALPVVAV